MEIERNYINKGNFMKQGTSRSIMNISKELYKETHRTISKECACMSTLK
jgi:hypothetical protein